MNNCRICLGSSAYQLVGPLAIIPLCLCVLVWFVTIMHGSSYIYEVHSLCVINHSLSFVLLAIAQHFLQWFVSP